MYGAVQWTVLRRRSSSSGGGGGSSSGSGGSSSRGGGGSSSGGSCRIGVFGMVSGSDGGRASGYSATEMGAKGGASGVGYVPRGKSKEGDDQVLCIYLGGYEERKRHVDDGAGNNRGGCSIPRYSVFVGELFEQWEMIVCLDVYIVGSIRRAPRRVSRVTKPTGGLHLIEKAITS
ncbi:hypothetical protein Hamer_G028358 [Homarus americanus]|uniref:Uncharacterized protein n=1 Tax=Homarus americanus TaxID=6706 RepID=A0A8J5K0F6_HOMAM|nr:hypothetical protein Hamer_G028358 [Homarus americanus]